ncbi:hypothetical protein CHS0354_031306 [Potamilus streckersoni]|uniref:Uncharacterized protein n=1 Tax=Potamilus streckersoni TaxID=2493646 RepID=A0AAE0TCB9_9BIVA|nr:hypothetical protein CHS0354_031306 [Potamilus streckersoni]
MEMFSAFCTILDVFMIGPEREEVNLLFALLSAVEISACAEVVGVIDADVASDESVVVAVDSAVIGDLVIVLFAEDDDGCKVFIVATVALI